MTLTNAQREEVLAELTTWIRTPYRGWSCLKGYGVDCGQLLYGVYRACGLLPEITLPRDYSLQVAKHRASTEYVDLVSTYFREIPEGEVLPADIVVYKLGLAYAHAAVVVVWPAHVIQAEKRHGVSGAHGNKSPGFSNAEKKFFTLKSEYCKGGF